MVSTLTKLSRTAYLVLFVGGSALAAPSCPAERAEALVPADEALCDQLEAAVRKPSALPQDQYEAKLAAFLRNYCHRREASGWKSDKHMRDTGPFIGSFRNGQWIGEYHGTHAPAVVWYSPGMVDWLKTNRAEGDEANKAEAPVPDGAIMVKEMFPPPTAHCKDVELIHLFAENGAALMVRDAKASYDGWYWGWFGWGKNAWAPTWPANAANAYPNTGFGLYCTNCHSSARDNQTFASLHNIKGEPGEPIAFLSQDFYLEDHFTSGDQRLGERRGASVVQPEFRTHHEGSRH